MVILNMPEYVKKDNEFQYPNMFSLGEYIHALIEINIITTLYPLSSSHRQIFTNIFSIFLLDVKTLSDL